MRFLILFGIVLIFCVIQLLILIKLKRHWIKWLPIEVIITGLLFCLIAYFNIFWTNSISVIAENQYLALFLAIPFSAAFIGCLLGSVIYKLFSRFHKQC